MCSNITPPLRILVLLDITLLCLFCYKKEHGKLLNKCMLKKKVRIWQKHLTMALHAYAESSQSNFHIFNVLLMFEASVASIIFAVLQETWVGIKKRAFVLMKLSAQFYSWHVKKWAKMRTVPSPGRICFQHYRVSYHNQQGFGSSHSHVESLDDKIQH